MATQNVGASSDNLSPWLSIDWAKCQQEVRRLQARIVKATQEGRWGKVNALQWLLTHSFAGKALAVKRVTENKGKRTPGVDKIIWSTPAAKSGAILLLKRRGYQPQPLRRLYIPKSSDQSQLRPLGIPTMLDRAQQALYLLALEPVAETTADPHSYGFRSQRSTADAIEQCFKLLGRKCAPQWILEADIKSCFDKISHDWLIANIPTDSAILQKWLKAGYIENRHLFPTEAGTPQGGIISPSAANLALDGLQAMLATAFPKHTRQGQQAKVNFVRYADDFVITGSSKELLEGQVKPLVEEFLAIRGLTLSVEKTRITYIWDGFDFLGQNIRKYGEKLLIKPSRKNVSAFLRKVRAIVKGNKQARQIDLIRQLSPILRGWANYHRHVVAKAVFHRVDAEIWQTLWQWASRRHPNKGRRWIKRRYFHVVGTRHWVFAADTDECWSDGRRKRVELLYVSDTPIRRYCKIKAAANPFDPAWEPYFEERLGVKMQGNVQGRRKLIRLWLNQEGRCPNCHERITRTTGWTLHYLVPRVAGGKDTSSNLILLHPQCHRHVHDHQLTIVKPVPDWEL